MPSGIAMSSDDEIAVSLHADSLELLEGIASIKREDYEKARTYLLKSAESENITVRTESYLYLNYIETRLKNYEKALIYLEHYHKNAMSLFTMANDAQREALYQKQELNSILLTMEDQHKRRWVLSVALSIVLLGVFLMWIYLERKKVYFFFRKKKRELDRLTSDIQSKEDERSTISYHTYLLQADIFMQTPIYGEIKQLEKQQKSRECRVLTNSKQEQLQQELGRIFEFFQHDLNNLGANLTANDIKLCCLSLLPLSTYSKALCFGSTETGIIKQRKHYIKKKMKQESDCALLFDFIFSPR
ncbi:MAG: hypothetical protein ITG04_09305 [Proteiniphilum sp.]|nr:hypothetical protein [Proteiniphilum sp.]